LTTPCEVPVTSHSWTWPTGFSSQDSQVPQGVGPPAQFWLVSVRMRYASAISPAALKRSAPAPPVKGISLFEV